MNTTEIENLKAENKWLRQQLGITTHLSTAIDKLNKLTNCTESGFLNAIDYAIMHIEDSKIAYDELNEEFDKLVKEYDIKP